MTAREWQPGDVAQFAGERVVFTGNDEWLWAETGLAVRDQNRANLDARPLIVIDPEDREQVERLLRGYSGWTQRGADDDIADYPQYVDDMQVALREFANPTPPKPEEPLGLGAVVEDADGRLWVRDEPAGLEPRRWYLRGEKLRTWDELPAVRVLSEGVTQ